MFSKRLLQMVFLCLLGMIMAWWWQGTPVWSSNTTYYIDAVGGSDSNDGLSVDTAWQSFTPITTKSNSGSKFEAGDEILFKRGQNHESLNLLVIDGTGASDNPITVGAYGSGTDPVLRNLDTAEDRDAVMRVNGSYVVVENLKIADGTIGNITEHGIRLYGSNNTIRNVEITEVGIGITVNTENHSISNSNFHDLIMVVNTPGGDDDFGASGISVMASNVTIENNTFTDLIESSFDYGTDGDAMETFGAASNVLFRYNTVTTTDNMIEVGGTNISQVVDEFKIHHNVIKNAKRLLAVHNSGGLYEVTVQDVYFENNTVIKESGYTATEAFNFDGEPGSTFKVKNNIFEYDTLTNWDNMSGNYTHQYNLYNLTSVTNGPGSAWSLGTGELLNEDPLFTDLGSNDYSLQLNSPAKDTGTNLGYTADRDTIVIPQDGGYDMGAYERADQTITTPFILTDWSTAGSFLSSSNVNTAGVGEVALSGSWYNDSWLYRRTITIPAGTVPSTLTNYPLLVSIANDATLASNTQTLGEDIVFTNSDGETLLDFEIEKYDDGTGTLVSWVRVPTVSPTNDTILYLYYGNSQGGLVSLANPPGVWDSEYAAVYHFGETSGTQFDSTGNNNDTTSIMVSNQGGAAGAAGGANTYDGTDDVITVADSNSLDAVSGVTTETWVKFDTLPADRGPAQNAAVVRKTHSVSPWQSYILAIKGADNKAELVFPTFAGDFRGVGSGLALTSTTDYYYIAGGRNTTNAAVYVNGVDTTNTGYNANDSANLFASDSTLNLGSSYSTSDSLDGTMDEVRISRVLRPPAYFQAVYENISTPNDFATISSQQTMGTFTGSLTSPIFNTTASSYWETLSYSATTPGSSTVTIKIRSSNSPSMAGATDFSSCTAITSGSDISSNSCITDGHQYIQYQLSFSSPSSSDMSSLQDLTLSFSSSSPTPTPTPTASPAPTSHSFSASLPPSCGDSKPTGQPDLFEIRRVGTTAELYFTPVLDKTNAYHVVFGYKPGDERFGGVSLPVENTTNHGVQKITINHLNPRHTYAFTVSAVHGCSVGDWSHWLTAKATKRGSFFRYF